MVKEADKIQDRAFEFACRIVRLTEFLSRRSFVARTIARQILRSGTSVGANLEEASAAQSKPDFISKCCIATKEARETHYWLRLLSGANVLSADLLTGLTQEADELKKILGAIVRSTRRSANARSDSF